MEIVDAVESVPSPNTVPSTSRLKTSQTSFEKLTLELSLDLCGFGLKSMGLVRQKMCQTSDPLSVHVFVGADSGRGRVR